jgi:hypothetical protein
MPLPSTMSRVFASTVIAGLVAFASVSPAGAANRSSIENPVRHLYSFNFKTKIHKGSTEFTITDGILCVSGSATDPKGKRASIVVSMQSDPTRMIALQKMKDNEKLEGLCFKGLKNGTKVKLQYMRTVSAEKVGRIDVGIYVRTK